MTFASRDFRSSRLPISSTLFEVSDPLATSSLLMKSS